MTCACWRPSIRRTPRRARLHRGARPQPAALPDYLIPLGRTLGFPANGAVSNLALTPTGSAAAAPRARAGGFDVVHVHEPIAPSVGWDALAFDARAARRARSTATRTNPVTDNVANLLGAGAGCSTTCTCGSPSPRPRPGPARRFFGGRYRRHPQRRRRPAGRPRPRAGAAGAAADRVRRPGGRAQGPARAAARLRGAARARPRRAQIVGADAGRGRADAARRRAASPRSARSTTTRSTRACARPTCSARRRWAARASAWC